MLIKYIKAKNFRQFRELEINFSTDPHKNVTIISGNNGSGKTTLAQAFTWCLYNEVTYKDSLLNGGIEEELTLGQSSKVEVEISLEHDGTEFIIIREQTYTKNQKGKASTSNQNMRTKMFKKVDGKLQSIRETGIEIEIDKILPKDLSQHFFFSGERINQLSISIKKGGKNSEFEKAVKNLLGLAPYLEAKSHLKNVIKDYDSLYKIDKNNELSKLIEDISTIKNNISKIDIQLEEKAQELENKEKLEKEKSKELLQYEDSEKLEKERLKYENDMKKCKQDKISLEKEILSFLNEDILSFMSQYYIKKIINELSKCDFTTEKGIPGLEISTIDYLLKNKRCLCGHEILENSEEYKSLIDLREKLSPYSIRTRVSSFLSISKNKLNDKNLYQKVVDKYKNIKEIENKILDIKDCLYEIDTKLSGEKILFKIKSLNQELKNIKNERKNLTNEIATLNGKKAEQNVFLKDRERKRDKKLNENKLNRKISIYKGYVEKIYDNISKALEENEKKLREKLEKEVDNIFNTIYNGQINILIDEKYNVSTTINRELSDGQSNAVILSFIAGIINLSKEAKLNTESEFYGESYPLVMDAPLSNFDKSVIKNICDVLPNIAEQVIIFIKDTDGDLAKEHLINRIGVQKQLKKIDEFNTKLVEE